MKISVELNKTETDILRSIKQMFGEETLKSTCEMLLRQSMRAWLNSMKSIREKGDD